VGDLCLDSGIEDAEDLWSASLGMPSLRVGDWFETRVRRRGAGRVIMIGYAICTGTLASPASISAMTLRLSASRPAGCNTVLARHPDHGRASMQRAWQAGLAVTGGE